MSLSYKKLFYPGALTPKNMIIIPDAGRDHDDELALTVLRGLSKLGYVNLIGAVVNLSQDDRRARLVKGALNALGFDEHVPVAIGCNDNPSYEPRGYEFDASYMASADTVETDGQALIRRLCEQAVEKNERVDLCLIAGMRDARNFIRDHPALSADALGLVSIMGGVQVQEGLFVLNEDEQVVPSAVYNNAVGDMSDTPKVAQEALDLYEILQDLDINTRIVSRDAAYGAQVSPNFYHELATIECDVTHRLKSHQKAAVETTLWPKVVPDLGLNWFHNVFTDGELETLYALKQLPKAPPYAPGESPWDYTTKLNAYDPLTVMAALIPDDAGLFLPVDQDVRLDIVGIDKENQGIVDAQAVVSVLLTLAKFGASEATTFNAYLEQQQSQNKASDFERGLIEEL